jgi:hypothetical protein
MRLVMVFAAAVGALGASACYGPSYADCEIQCAAGVCPSGLTCEQGYCRTAAGGSACTGGNPDAAIDQVGPPGDRDNDTIADGDDNCPDRSNRDQADEDGDDLGDVCDPCPPLGSQAENTDTDGDGVGDGCDGNVGAPDRIVMFEGFAAGTPTATGFVQTTGCWSFANGQAIVASAGGQCAMLWPRVPAPGHTAWVVSARTTIDSADLLNRSRFVGVVDSATGLNGGGLACEYGLTANNAPRMQIFDLVGGGVRASGTVQNVVGMPVVVAFRWDPNGGEEICTVRPTGGTPLFSPPSGFPPNALAGVRKTDVGAHVDWVMIVSTL